jgi:hypothetical protein
MPFALSWTRSRRLIAGPIALILVITVTIAIPHQVSPLLDKAETMILGRSALVRYDVAGDTIWVNPGIADYVDTVRQFVDQNVQPDEGILVAPYEPGLYSILGRTSPIWDPFPLFPVAEDLQEEIIHSLNQENVNWALISNQTMDGMNERRFSNTHDLVWQYLTDEFVAVEELDLPADHFLLHRRRSKEGEPTHELEQAVPSTPGRRRSLP